jgi:hypothetical protein
MGYANYLYDGKLCGYAVPDECNQDGCETPIDRGLAYSCGNGPGEADDYCDGYFCGEHLYFVDPEVSDSRQLCGACLADAEVLVVSDKEQQ